MPELPEVETTCRGIQSIIGCTLEHVIVRQKQLRWPVSQEIPSLKNIRILEVARRAKYILIYTTKGAFIIHLGMSGRLCVISNKLAPEKHDHLDFILNNGTLLRYTDPRRFGAVLWTKDEPLNFSLLAKLGPEPLSDAFNGQYLLQRAQNKKTTIKQLIMDQNIVVGIGNIYANEALFTANILPIRQSNTLTLAECKKLVLKIQTILKQAILQGGTTLRDFLSADGKPGYFSQKLFVYGREDEKCLCGTPLNSIRVGQRATVYCPSCQK